MAEPLSSPSNLESNPVTIDEIPQVVWEYVADHELYLARHLIQIAETTGVERISFNGADMYLFEKLPVVIGDRLTGEHSFTLLDLDTDGTISGISEFMQYTSDVWSKRTLPHVTHMETAVDHDATSQKKRALGAMGILSETRLALPLHSDLQPLESIDEFEAAAWRELVAEGKAEARVEHYDDDEYTFFQMLSSLDLHNTHDLHT